MVSLNHGRIVYITKKYIYWVDFQFSIHAFEVILTLLQLCKSLNFKQLILNKSISETKMSKA